MQLKQPRETLRRRCPPSVAGGTRTDSIFFLVGICSRIQHQTMRGPSIVVWFAHSSTKSLWHVTSDCGHMGKFSWSLIPNSSRNLLVAVETIFRFTFLSYYFSLLVVFPVPSRQFHNRICGVLKLLVTLMSLSKLPRHFDEAIKNFLDSLMSHQTLTARHNQFLFSIWTSPVSFPSELPLRSGLARGLSRDPS